jgi:thiol:disulfide interchange protein DsbD
MQLSKQTIMHPAGLLALFFITTINNSIFCNAPTITAEANGKNTQKISLMLPISPGDYVHKEFIDFSVDTPNVIVSDWNTSCPTVEFFDPVSKEKKKGYEKSLTITLNATRQEQSITKASLHFSYYLQSKKTIIEEIFPISFVEKTQEVAAACEQAPAPQIQESLPAESKTAGSAHKKASWSSYVSDLITGSNSIWVRLLLVLLLGLLMSLTPCIYPMIPITMGILQANGSKSVASNFLLSLCYTLGIATTFALLGLLAAFTGQIFGQVMMQPWVIIPLVCFLTYLALSMLGIYEMHIPRFLQTSTKAKGGSYLSAFIFGAASGTVASPCLSPGLLLLLSLVTTIGSKLLGFILLFAFGVGLSIPLIIIGTFAGSMNVLPQSGMWMVEIKKIFGFVLLATNFYFLSNIMPMAYLLWLMAATAFVAGVFYLRDLKPHDAPTWKHIKNFVGIGLISSSVFISIKAYEHGYLENLKQKYGTYAAARNHARETKKMLFIDVGGPFCSICKKIDADVLMKPEVLTELQKFVSIKLDADPSNEFYQQIQERFPIKGVPTILIIDPTTEREVKRWGCELLDIAITDFINELQSFSTQLQEQ